MAETGADALFDRFLEARERGETPDVAAYLERAGPGREELGRLIDAYLRTAPVRPPTEEQRLSLVARVNRTTPLTEARVARGLRVDDVVDALERALGVPGKLRAKLRTAYQRLEGAQLEPGRVDARVWDALATFFEGLDVRRLAAAIPRPPEDERVYARMGAPEGEALPAAAPPAAEPSPSEPDEVDRLFYGAS